MASSECTADMSRLHEIGKIQNCGYIFVVEQAHDTPTIPAGWNIVGASRNVETARWACVSSTSELRGKNLGYVFHGGSLKTVCTLLQRHDVTRRISSEHISLRANRNIGEIRPAVTKTRGEVVLHASQPTIENRDTCGHAYTHGNENTEKSIVLSCTVSGSNPGWFLVEIEEKHGSHEASEAPTSGLLQVAKVLEHVPLKRNPQESLGELADAFIDMFAFDRVMVYRFETDNSGTVIHESVRPESQVASSYLDLRFPATDIPSSARELLRLNGVRFIADTSALGVPVDLLQGVAVVDLSMSSLRAASECHLSYLRNMGVKSSFVVAIIVDTQLWGLISFHSYTSLVKLSSEERIMVEMATSVTSSLVSHYQREEAANASIRLSRTLGNFSSHTRIHSFLSAEHLTLLSVLNVDSIIVSHNSRPAMVFGNEDISLTPEECNVLLDDDQSKHMVKFASLEARGVAFFCVRSFALIFVRGSVTTQVKWAGQPDTPLLDQERLHPRASFDKFVEDSVDKVEPWSPATANLLSVFRTGVSSYLYEEALPADMHERVAHISHELRTPFHGVMSSLDVLRAEHAHMSVGERDEIMDSAIMCGNSMMSSLDDILDIAKDRHGLEIVCNDFIASNPIHVTATALKHFAAKNAIELGTVVSVTSTKSSNSTTGTVISPDSVNAGLHEVTGNEHEIKRILLNLVNNAVKFTPSEGKVDISLLVFDSLQEATAWWSIETDRFDANVWIGTPPNTECVEDVGKPEASTGTEAGEAGPPCGAPQRWYVYCVEDTGVGIPKRNLSSITKAYRQVSEGAGKSYQGTGLGLHICLNQVQDMLGRLGVASTQAEEGRKGRSGTLFAVVLPLLCPASKLESVELTTVDSQGVKIDAEALAVQADAVASAIIGTCSDWDDKTDDGDNIIGLRKEVAFIVVDDHQVNVKLMKRKIESVLKHTHGRVKVLSATDGLTALELLKTVQGGEANSDNTDIDDAFTTTVLAGFFMDYHMPKMDGVECTRRVRLLEAEKGWPRTYICGFTADATEATRNIFLDAGGQDILGKPFTPGQVESVCKAMLIEVLKRGDNNRPTDGGG